MKTLRSIAVCTFVWIVAASGCSSNNGAQPRGSGGSSGTGGAGGAGGSTVSSSGGSSMTSPTGGTAGTSATSGGIGGTTSSTTSSGGSLSGGGGSSGTAAGGAGSDASLNNDSAADANTSSLETSGPSADAGAPSSFSLWVEAESGKMMNGANVRACGTPGDGQYGAAANCAPETLKDGASCCSAGKLVQNLLGAAGANCFGMPLTCGSGIILTVTVPADGQYDVTWWFHCGGSDSYQDNTCGGLRYTAGAPGVCRPHEIVVNGVLTGDPATKAYYYQFPCWATSWALIHPAVTTLSLKAGDNTIYIHAPNDYISAGIDGGLDSADLDVIHVTPVGQGTGTRVTPVSGAN